jgi:hypothetical protein
VDIPHRALHASRAGRILLALLLLAGLCLGAGPWQVLAAGVVGDGTIGTLAPPVTLGPYTMLPFGPDPEPAGYTTVQTVTGPTGEVVFSRAGQHAIVGRDWGTWSHGYTGDVYYFPMAAIADQQAPAFWDQVTLTLPPETVAFYLYVEPNAFGTYAVEVSVPQATSGPVMVSGRSGATCFAFYSAGALLSQVTVAVDGYAGGFAIGEFGVAQGAPVAEQALSDARANVGVVVYGGWAGMPVQAWVGGTAQPTLYTALNDEGEAAVLFSFWPPEGTAWQVSVLPELPAGLDPALWEIRPVGMRRGSTWGSVPASGSVTIAQGSQLILYYQLYSTAGG